MKIDAERVGSVATICPSIRATDDGSSTLVHPILGELYHSNKGAVGEALHVYINSGFNFMQGESLSILEMGFGSGLNALLSLQEAEIKGVKVDYHAIELYPISLDVARGLSFSEEQYFMGLHKADWNERVNITERFSLTKWDNNLLDIEFLTTFNLVYFDAFAPDSQPELWSEDVFRKIAGAMTEGGVLVTYSCKGDVKRALRAAGFEVHRIKGALGKHQMIRAIKI